MATFNNGEAGLSVRTKLNNVLQHADGTAATLTFNDAGADVDVRIEGVGQTHAFFLDAGTSNIGIGTSSATSKLTVAGDASVAGVVTAVSMRDSTNRRITAPGGGSYTTATALVTGAIAISLPVGYTNHMIKATIKVFDLATQESFDVVVSGYNYSTGPTWFNCSAYIIGSNASDINYTVRFGFNSTSSKCVIYIGELTTAWAYPQVNVVDVQLGYNTTGLDAWDDGWSIGFEASAFQNITQTLSNIRVGSRLIGAGQTTAALTDAGARSDLLRLSSVGTAAGTGGGIVFTNTQADSANSLGMAAIKSLLSDGSSNTRGDLAFSTRNAVTDTNLTERMRLTSAGNLGIGTSSPTTRLHLSGAGNTLLTIQDSSGVAAIDFITGAGTQRIISGLGGTNNIGFYTASTERLRIDASGNVGIGLTPTGAARLEVAGNIRTSVASGGTITAFETDGTRANQIILGADASGSFVSATFSNAGSAVLRLQTAGVERARIDASGNLGISATPPANTTYPGIFFPQSGIFDYQGDGWLFYNAYTTGVGLLKYRATGLQVAAYSFGQAGAHTWHSAPSGTAGGAITLTQRMILDNAGQLGIGTSSPTARLHVNANGGTAILEGTDHSYLSFYPRTYATGRKAYAGFASTSITNFSIVNEDTGSILLGTNGSTSNFIISPLGNIGINNTPRTWGNTYKAISINGAGSHIAANGSNRIELGTNSYLDTDNTTRRYDVTQAATTYIQATGEHQWYTAPSGTAGNPITFTQVMTLDNTGELGIGTTSPGAKLDVRGAALGGTATNSSLVTNFGTPDANASSLRVLNYRHTTGTDHTTGEMRLQKRVDATDFGYIGFRHNAITFGTAAEQMRIDSTGNVGIGTNSPSGRLALVTAAATILRMKGGTSTGQGSALVIEKAASTDTLFAAGDAAPLTGGTPDISAMLYTNASIPLLFAPGGTEKIRMDASGNLGVGTQSPTNKLHIVSTPPASVPAAGVAGHPLAVGATPYGLAGGVLSDGTAYLQATRWDTTATNYNLALQPNGGSVGIGIISPVTKLHVAGAGGTTLRIESTNGLSPELSLFSNGVYDWKVQGGTSLRFVRDATETMRIDASGNVGIGGTANASSILDVQSTTKGFLPPRMTTTQRDAITSPATGLVIYNTTTGREEGYSGTQWIPKIPLDTNEDLIINGGFDIWQRGTSSTVAGYVAADRWQNDYAGGTVTQSRQAFTLGDTFGVNSPQFFLRQGVTGQTLAAHYARIQHRIEGVRSYAGQTITVLGWAKRASGTGNMALEGFQIFGTGGTPSANTQASIVGTPTITLGTSWTPFAITMTVPSVSTKTLGTNNDDYFAINFFTSAGSDFNARTNSLGLQTIEVDMWGVHVRVGTWTATDATLYRQKNIQEELDKCYRYYYRVTSGTVSQAVLAAGGFNQSTTASRNVINFPVRMRRIPTALEQSGTATHYAVLNGATATACTAVPVFQNATEFNSLVNTTTGATLVAGQGSLLVSNGVTGAYLGWSAEI